ncbi:MAG: hypothetical protein ACRDHZ_08710 [Ktedonobacteraceae bacterium]
MIHPQNDLPPNANWVPPLLIIECAWCLQEAGHEMGNGSHGICEKHAQHVLATWRAKKREQRH